MPRDKKKSASLGRELGALGGSPLAVALLVALPVVLAALFHVWTKVTTVRLGYALSRAGNTHKRILEKNRALRVEVAALKAPERLKELAQAHYKLAPPKSEQVVRLTEAKYAQR